MRRASLHVIASSLFTHKGHGAARPTILASSPNESSTVMSGALDGTAGVDMSMRSLVGPHSRKLLRSERASSEMDMLLPRSLRVKSREQNKRKDRHAFRAALPPIPITRLPNSESSVCNACVACVARAEVATKSQSRTGHTRGTETRRTQKPNRTLGSTGRRRSLSETHVRHTDTHTQTRTHTHTQQPHTERRPSSAHE